MTLQKEKKITEYIPANSTLNKESNGFRVRESWLLKSAVLHYQRWDTEAQACEARQVVINYQNKPISMVPHTINNPVTQTIQVLSQLN
jgi:hypothetical protein